MKKRIKLIITCIAMMILSVLCIFTVKAKSVKAAESDVATYATDSSVVPGLTLSSTLNLTSNFKFNYWLTFEKKLNEFEQNSVFVIMSTTDYNKFRKTLNEGLSFKGNSIFMGHEVPSETTSTFDYNFYPDKLTSLLAPYCDDFYLTSGNLSYPSGLSYDKLKYSFNRKISTPNFDFELPENLNANVYFYCGKLLLTQEKGGNALSGYTSTQYLKSSGSFSYMSPGRTSDMIYNELEQDNLWDDTRKGWQQKLGIYTGNTAAPVIVQYKSCEGYMDIRSKEIHFTMDSLYLQCKSKVIEEMYKQLDGITDITSFNCIYRNYTYSADGNKLNQGSRIVLQAADYYYEYVGSGSGTIYVMYEDFRYSDFSVRIENNDPRNDLSCDFYFTDVVLNGSLYTMTLAYSEINEVLGNKLRWFLAEDNSTFNVTQESFNADGVVVNNSNGKVAIAVKSDSLVLSFTKENENALSNVAIRLIANVVPDFEVKYSIRYSELSVDGNGVVTDTVKVSEEYTTMNSSFLLLNTFYNFLNKHGALVINAARPSAFGSGENAVEHYIPSSVDIYPSEDRENFYTLKVGYTYRTILRVKENDEFKRFIQLDHADRLYDVNDLKVTVPQGYRISDVNISSGLKLSFDDRRAEEFTVETNTDLYQKKVLDVGVNYTDTLYLNVEYLVNYEYENAEDNKVPSGFARRKITEFKDVPVNTFAKLYEPTETELMRLLGLDSLTVVGKLGKFKDCAVERVGSVYYLKLNYHYATLKVIQSDGSYDFKCDIALRSFADWCTVFDKEWSVDVLNTPEHIVFESQGDINRDDLYGFFYVSVFQEQKKNLDDLFAGYTADGCRTFFDCKEVKGSDFYKTCDKFGFALYLPALIAEIINDDNGTYYSYFSFIDGTGKDGAYAANNKADDYFDTDSAVKNTFEDIGESITNWWKENGVIVKILKAILGIAGILLVVWLGLKLAPLFIGAFNDIGAARTDGKSKGEQRKVKADPPKNPTKAKKPKTTKSKRGKSHARKK